MAMLKLIRILDTHRKSVLMALSGLLLLTVTCVILAVVYLVNYEPTYPLGGRLEYLGREKYGCPLICDTTPGVTYYYATDIASAGISTLFVNMHVSDYDKSNVDNPDAYTEFSINTEGVTSEISAFITYYPNIQSLRDRHGYKLPYTGNKHIIAIDSTDYDLLRSRVK